MTANERGTSLPKWFRWSWIGIGIVTPLAGAPVFTLVLLAGFIYTYLFQRRSHTAMPGIPASLQYLGFLWALALTAGAVLVARETSGLIGVALSFYVIFALSFLSGVWFTHTSSDWQVYVRSLAISTALLSLYAIGMTLVTGERARLPWVDSNYLATLLLLGLGTCFGTLMNSANKRWRIAAQLFVLLTGVALWATGSRGAMIGFGVFLLVFAARNWRMFAIYGVAVAAAGALVAKGIIPVRLMADPFRIKMWQAAGEMARDYPWTGIGLTNYGYFWPRYIDYLPTHHQLAHNLFLNILAETGVPGFLVFMSAVGLMLWWGMRVVINTKDIRLSSLLALFVAMLVRDLVDVDLVYAGSTDMVFWLIPGIWYGVLHAQATGKEAALLQLQSDQIPKPGN